MIYDSLSYVKCISALKRRIKQKGKRVLASDNVYEIVNYIHFLVICALEFNVKIETLDCKKYIEKIVSTKDEEKICRFIGKISKWNSLEHIFLIFPALASIFKEYNQDTKITKLIISFMDEWDIMQQDGEKISIKDLTREGESKKRINMQKKYQDYTLSIFEDVIVNSGGARHIYNFAIWFKEDNTSRLEEALIKTEDAKYIYAFARDVKGANIQKLGDALIKTKDLDYIYYFARDVKGSNISRLEEALIETKDVEYIHDFARYNNTMYNKRSNVKRLCSVLIDLDAMEEAYDVISHKLDQIKDINKFINKFVIHGQIDHAKELFIQYNKIKQSEIVKNKNNTISYDYDKLFMSEMIKNKLITREDIDDYLIRVSNKEQKNLAMNIHQLSEKSQKKLLHTKHPDLNEAVDISTVRNQFIDYSTSLSLSEEGKRWLINFSLIRFNVLPSAVKDFKEVKENITLYLETLKKCDEYKYYYYKDAFEGKITFEQADTYYKYYCEQQLPKRLTTAKFKDGLEKVLKLKYSKK